MWDRGMTQTKLGSRIGINQGDLSKKIHGKKRWHFHEFIDACDVLGVDATVLLATMWDSAPTGTPVAAPVTQTKPARTSPGKPERRKTHRYLRLAPVAA